MFPEGVLYGRENESDRTKLVNSLFALSKQLAQKMAEKEKGEKQSKTCFSPLVVRRGIEPLLPE